MKPGNDKLSVASYGCGVAPPTALRARTLSSSAGKRPKLALSFNPGRQP